MSGGKSRREVGQREIGGTSAADEAGGQLPTSPSAASSSVKVDLARLMRCLHTHGPKVSRHNYVTRLGETGGRYLCCYDYVLALI